MLALFESADKEISQTYTPEEQPNAKGIRTALGSFGPLILQLNLDSPIGFGQLSADTIRLQLTESREGTLKGDHVKALMQNAHKEYVKSIKPWRRFNSYLAQKSTAGNCKHELNLLSGLLQASATMHALPSVEQTIIVEEIDC